MNRIAYTRGLTAGTIFAGLAHVMRAQPVFDVPDLGGLDLKELATGFMKATDEVKKNAETVMTEIKNLGKDTGEAKENADKALTTMNTFKQELDLRVKAIEQKITRPGGEGTDEMKTVGASFVDDEKVKAFLATDRRGTAKVSLEGKAVINLTSGTAFWGATASTANSMVAPDRRGLVLLPDRQFVVRDLITPGETASNSIEYAVETAFDNSAAPVAEGALKPKSSFTFDLRATPVRTLAHLVKASRQIMDDVPMLRTTIDGRLRYGLSFVEDAQLLYGDGSGQNLTGIIPQATAYAAPAGATPSGTETAVDRLRIAILQAALALYPPSGIVLHPIDWANIEMLKDGMGRYLIGDPQGTLGKRLWSLPVVDTMSMTAGTFLVGAFRMGAQIFDRMAVEVMLSTENVDDFEKNMVTIRCEERIALAVYRPAAFITGALPT